MSIIAVTGATGFVGQALCNTLEARGHEVRGIVRRDPSGSQVAVGNIDGTTDWSGALAGASAVVHLAARVHVMKERIADPLAAFREVNVAGTTRLAMAAARQGVKRLVFVSSIKVNGETTNGVGFTSQDVPHPTDPYAISKFEAEQQLAAIAANEGIELVVIRPPLVYGPGVGANFLSMLRWLQRGLPLPLGAIHNRRSLVALPNLVDLIATCIEHPAAANRTFLVSDGEDLSTTDLLVRLSRALGRNPRLIPVPERIVRGLAVALGKAGIAQRLCDSLQVDIEHTRRTLDWQPPIAVDTALAATAKNFLDSAAR